MHKNKNICPYCKGFFIFIETHRCDEALKITTLKKYGKKSIG